MIRLSADNLFALIGELFASLRVPVADAREVARMLVQQEMRGVRTHGLRRVFPNLDGLKSAQINPSPNRAVISDRDATIVLDGDHGLGMLGCHEAMRGAIEKASRFGIGIGIVRNNNHFLSAAPHCLEAESRGMIGIAMSNTFGSMGYPGTTARAIANSPLGFAIPTAAGFPIVFDSALTTSGGKLEQYIREGARIPIGLFGLDASGRPSDDPKAVLHGGTPMPIGGYKGAGLAILVEMLSGVLGGGGFLHGIVPPEKREGKHQAESQCCIAIDIAHFMPLADFQKRAANFIADLKNNPLAPDANEITLPGERMHRAMQAAQRDGIEVEPDVRESLNRWATALGVRSPLVE